MDDNFPDPDTGPIDQRSVVNVLSGGALEVDGAGASFVIGASSPAADGSVTVSGAGSTLTVKGADSVTLVGDVGTGALAVGSGGSVTAERIVVGRAPESVGTLRIARGGALEVGSLLAVGKNFDPATRTTLEPGGTGSVVDEAGSRVRYGALEVGARGSTNLEESVHPEPVPELQEDIDDNLDEILWARPETPTTGEDGAASREDDERERDEADREGDEETAAGESGEDERERLPMCPV